LVSSSLFAQIFKETKKVQKKKCRGVNLNRNSSLKNRFENFGSRDKDLNLKSCFLFDAALRNVTLKHHLSSDVRYDNFW
jgi:hypothetical protein